MFPSDVRYRMVDREQISLVRTMMANGFVKAIIHRLRQTMNFREMTMDPEEKMSPEDLDTQQRHYRNYMEAAMLSEFAIGNLYFASATAEPSVLIETPEPSNADISSESVRSSTKKQMLVPIMPDDSELMFRLRIKTQATPEFFHRSELNEGNPNEMVPRVVVTESSPEQPNAETGALQSKCGSLLFDYLTMMQNQNFQTHANFSNSRPVTVVYKSRKNLSDGVTSISAQPSQNQFLYPTRFVKERMTMMAETNEAVRTAQMSVASARDGTKDLTYFWNNPLIRSQQPFKHHVEDGILVLPEDHQVGPQPLLAQAPNNLHDLEHRLVLSACAVFGVPLSMIFYGSGRTTTIASTTERQTLVETVRELKNKYEEFLGRVFAHLNGGKKCRFDIKLNVVHDIEVYETLLRIGMMDRATLAQACSKALGIELKPVDPSEVPITMPASKMNLYAAKEMVNGGTPTLKKGLEDVADDSEEPKPKRRKEATSDE